MPGNRLAICAGGTTELGAATAELVDSVTTVPASLVVQLVTAATAAKDANIPQGAPRRFTRLHRAGEE
ncbi:hypothetical protein [Nocardia lijiangensis]|uniref:hypothetical protein n=1 Tax=Nocardia lijiangensis TaxID=299618 RepID=UPI000AD44D5B|nr:hypothetical protein [Nocardia lijiangensis]